MNTFPLPLLQNPNLHRRTPHLDVKNLVNDAIQSCLVNPPPITVDKMLEIGCRRAAAADTGGERERVTDVNLHNVPTQSKSTNIRSTNSLEKNFSLNLSYTKITHLQASLTYTLASTSSKTLSTLLSDVLRASVVIQTPVLYNASFLVSAQ